MIIDHDNKRYRSRWARANANRFNGAFYYSKEIVKNIIPRVITDRNWITVNTYGNPGCDHSIVFIHNNLHPENYSWLSKYRDVVLVCGVPETCEKVAHLGKAIYLPLSVDVRMVKRYLCDKDKEAAYAGRSVKFRGLSLPEDCEIIGDLPRTKLLPEIARYKRVYAVGRTAIEAKILGCEICAYDPRFPDPSIWEVLDNKDAAKMLQKELDKIDNRRQNEKSRR